MKATSKVLVILGLLVGSSICALAGNITWTFNDVAFLFPDGNINTVSGWFSTNYAGTMNQGFSIVVSGGEPNAAFTASIFVDSYLPFELGFANSGFSKYVNMYLTSPLTSAGGLIPFGPGLYGNNDCGTSGPCGTLLIGNGYDPYIFGVVPEPASLLVLGSSLAIFGTMLRRKLSRA